MEGNGDIKICAIDQKAKDLVKKLRFKKTKENEAIVLKVEVESLKIVVDEQYKDASLEDIAEEIPASQPRYIIYSYAYHHDDGRISYPFVFIYVSPVGCKPELQMMYAGSKISLVNELDASKVFEVRNVEDLNEEWLKEKLKFFR